MDVFLQPCRSRSCDECDALLVAAEFNDDDERRGGDLPANGQIGCPVRGWFRCAHAGCEDVDLCQACVHDHEHECVAQPCHHPVTARCGFCAPLTAVCCAKCHAALPLYTRDDDGTASNKINGCVTCLSEARRVNLEAYVLARRQERYGDGCLDWYCAGCVPRDRVVVEAKAPPVHDAATVCRACAVSK